MKRISLIIFFFILLPAPVLSRGYTYDELYDYHSKGGLIFIMEMCSRGRTRNNRGYSFWDTQYQNLLRAILAKELKSEFKRDEIFENPNRIANIWMSVYAKHMKETCPDVW